MQETHEGLIRSLGQEEHLEDEMATRSSYSCLENLTDRGAWKPMVHRVSELDMTEHMAQQSSTSGTGSLFQRERRSMFSSLR